MNGDIVCETKLKETKFCYVWNIKKFFSIGESYKNIKSSLFKTSKTEWYLELLPWNKKENNEEYFIGIYLYLKTCEFCSKLNTVLSLAFVNEKGETLFGGNSLTYAFDVAGGGYGYSTLMSRKELQAKMTTNCDVKIVCDITFGELISKTFPFQNTNESEGSLMSDLREYFAQSDNFDIVLKGKDGIEAKAHKFILITRSKVFERMFIHDTIEKESGCINIEDTDGEILKQMIHFLYTDKLNEIEMNVTMNLLIAADKYQLIKLKSLCEQNLIENADVANVADLLALCNLIDCKELKSNALKIVKKNAAEVVTTYSWNEQMKQNPNICKDALYALIEN